MLVAFRFHPGCVKEAGKNPQIELFECELTFHPLAPYQ